MHREKVKLFQNVWMGFYYNLVIWFCCCWCCCFYYETHEKLMRSCITTITIQIHDKGNTNNIGGLSISITSNNICISSNILTSIKSTSENNTWSIVDGGTCTKRGIVSSWVPSSTYVFASYWSHSSTENLFTFQWEATKNGSFLTRFNAKNELRPVLL